MDATTSTIFLKLVGRTKHLGDFVVYTAGNFRGGSKVFELQNAYVSFLGFTMGYDYSTFMDLAALPPRSIMRGLPDRFSAVPPCYAMSVLSVRDGKRV